MRIQTAARGTATASIIVVTNHAVRRYAERIDGHDAMPSASLHDGEAVAELERQGYPVAAVRRYLARYAEDAVTAGAKSVNIGRFSLVISGNTVITCAPRAPRNKARVRLHHDRDARRGRNARGFGHHAEW